MANQQRSLSDRRVDHYDSRGRHTGTSWYSQDPGGLYRPPREQKEGAGERVVGPAVVGLMWAFFAGVFPGIFVAFFITSRLFGNATVDHPLDGLGTAMIVQAIVGGLLAILVYAKREGRA